MGIAGQTGLAGGVHVHFSMQIDGVETNPREWWDEHWIKDRILSKLGAGEDRGAEPGGAGAAGARDGKAAEAVGAGRRQATAIF